MTDWPVKTLGEVCLGVERRDPALSDHPEFTYIDLSAVNQSLKQIDGARVLSVEEAPGRARQLVKTGDVLVSTVRPNLNAVALVGSELDGATASTGFCVLRSDPRIIDPGLLFAWARNQVFIDELTAQAKGASYPAVTDNIVKSLAITVPPLEEQKRLVALLDAATARVTELTACYEQARTHANNLFSSALRDALELNPDWPVKTLSEVCEFQNGYAFRSSEYVKNGHALIRIKNVQQGEVTASDDVFVQIPKDGSLDQFVLNAGDILMSLTGYLGRVGRLNETDLPAALNQRVAKVSTKTKSSLFDGFLYRVLDSQWFRDQVDVFGRGAAQQNVGTSDISKIEIPVPPIEEQKEIVARLDSIRAKTSEMVAAYDSKLTAAKNLRQSILESAFKGEL